MGTAENTVLKRQRRAPGPLQAPPKNASPGCVSAFRAAAWLRPWLPMPGPGGRSWSAAARRSSETRPRVARPSRFFPPSLVCLLKCLGAPLAGPRVNVQHPNERERHLRVSDLHLTWQCHRSPGFLTSSCKADYPFASNFLNSASKQFEARFRNRRFQASKRSQGV